MTIRLHREGGLFVVEVALSFKNREKDHEVRLVLDTGAAITIVDTDIINHLGYSAGEDGIRRSALDGAAGKSVGYVIKMPTFKSLGHELTGFEIACHDMDTRLGVAGLLGMNFLNHFRVDMNFNSGEIFRIENLTQLQ